MVKVKICGITRQEDAELAVELGADALGFVFEPTSPRYVGARGLKLVDAVPPYVMCVGVYGQLNSVEVLNLNAVQCSELGGATSIFSSAGLSRIPPLIKVVRVKADEDVALTWKLTKDWLSQFRIEARGVLLDAFDPQQFGGTGKRVDWAFAAEFVHVCPIPVVLAGGLVPDNVGEAIRVVRPYAIDVSSGVEASPGVKDPKKLRDFIQAAKGSG